MTKARLTRISTSGLVGPYPLRTKVVEGAFHVAPVVGESFTIYGESLTEGRDTRAVTTSPVKYVTVTEEGCTFRTENSTYTLEPLE